MIALLVIGLVVAACALLAIVASANELSKENHTDQKAAALLTTDGDIVHTAEVESFAGLEALLSASKAQLDKLAQVRRCRAPRTPPHGPSCIFLRLPARDDGDDPPMHNTHHACRPLLPAVQVSFSMTYVDNLPSSFPASLSSLAGKTADTTRKVAAYEKFDDHIVLILQECEMDIKITASEALVRRAGQTVATVGNFNPSGRRLAASPAGAPVRLYHSEAELAAQAGARGRRLSFGGALMTSGSFTMMASTGM